MRDIEFRSCGAKGVWAVGYAGGTVSTSPTSTDAGEESEQGKWDARSLSLSFCANTRGGMATIRMIRWPQTSYSS